MKNILIAKKANVLKIASAILTSVEESRELIIDSNGITLPYIKANFLFDEIETEIFLIAPIFEKIVGGKYKNYTIMPGEYSPTYSDVSKVVKSFANILFDIFEIKVSEYLDSNRVVLELYEDPTFVLENSPLGCPNCGKNDNAVLKSAFKQNEIEKINKLNLKELIEKEGQIYPLQTADYDTQFNLYKSIREALNEN